jgi:hypothetical protein
LATYSSDGPRQIFYETDGTAVTPNDFTSTGGRVLQKPDLTAATGVTASTTFPVGGEFSPFNGTSASAPHAGAIAALLLSYRPDLTPDQVRAAMTGTTLNLGGATRDVGAGIVMADQAIAYINPTVNFVYPTAAQALPDTSAPLVEGFADDNFFTLSAVRVALARGTDGAWYDFVNGVWGTTTFNANNDVLLASGVGGAHTGWLAQLPLLPDGNYNLQAQSVDAQSYFSPWLSEGFTIVPVLVAFSPLTNGETVFDLSQIGGTISQPATVAFQIEQLDNNLYWDGSGSWLSDGTDPAASLPTTVTGTNWLPAPGVVLPDREQTSPGFYVLWAIATDTTGGLSTNEIVVTRSAPDTTQPLVTLGTITNGEVFTTPVIPALSGSAYDFYSGIASVSVYLNQFSASGLLYWNGTSWSSTPAVLTASYNPVTVAWDVTNALPEGANLPNAGYEVEIVAPNNEFPPATTTLSVSFTVDDHPVSIFTYGSQFGPTPNNTWSDPANWNNGVPTSDSVAYINGYSVDNTSLGSVQIYGLNMSGGLLTTYGMLITNLNISGGVLYGGIINLPANGIFNWSGGTLTGAYNVPASATVNIAGSADKFLANATLSNNGAVYWNGGNIHGSSASVINNNGTFVMQSSSFFYNSDGQSPFPAFNNNGLMKKTISNGDTTFSPNDNGWVLNQNGTIDIENGALSMQSQLNVNDGAVFAGPGETRVDAGIASLYGASTIQQGATVELANGTFLGNNVFAGPGTFVWSGGTMQDNCTVASGANLSITGGAKTLTGALTNAGTGLWTGTGVISMGTASVFENDGIFTAENDSSFYNMTGQTPYPVFINNGSFVKANSVNTTLFDPSDNGVEFNNNGSISVQSGLLALGGGGTENKGSFTAVAGSHIDFLGGSFSLSGNLTFSGAGSTRINGGALTFGNSVSTIAAGATFEIVTGTAGGNNTFAGSGNINWSGGVIQGVENVAASVGMNITGTASKTLNQGVLNLAGNSFLTGNGAIDLGMSCAINNSGVFTVENDSIFYNTDGQSPYPVFNNTGTFRKTTTTGTTAFMLDDNGVTFNNSGIVDLQTGSLAINGGYTLSGLPRLNLVLGGPNPGTQYSQETFVGPGTLGGVLSVTLANGFTPTNGQSFAIVTYASETGQFASQQLPKLPDNLIWRTTYGPSAVTLKAAPGTAVTSPALLANGHFQFSLNGPSAASVIIEGTVNFEQWIPLLTNAPFNGSLLFDDVDAILYPGRYYHIQIQP